MLKTNLNNKIMATQHTKIYIIKAKKAPNGKPQHMKVGEEYAVGEENANLLKEKGLAEIIGEQKAVLEERKKSKK